MARLYTEPTATVFLKCDFWTKTTQISDIISQIVRYIMSTVKQTHILHFIFGFVFLSDRVCLWMEKIFKLNKENKRLHDLVMECIELAFCWPQLTPTVTWIWPKYNVVSLSRGNFTLTCKAQSAAAWKCGKVQAWVISKHDVLNTLTAPNRAIKCSLVRWADMEAYRNSPQLWKKMRLHSNLNTNLYCSVCTWTDTHKHAQSNHLTWVKAIWIYFTSICKAMFPVTSCWSLQKGGIV